jgi:methylation protein EvaC
MQPIANNFLSSLDEEEYKFNLTVEFDDETKLVSLGEFVRPELMFNDSYVYCSSNSKTMQKHFKDYATVLKEEFSPKQVMEIGSNDGVFIKNFSSDTTVAIEPCGNFAKITNSIGYKTYDKFWNLEVAEQIIQNHGKRDLISSSNCVCHMQNLDEAFSAINKCLIDDGIFVFEDPSLLKMLERISYDQIYDEHVFIFSALSVQNIFAASGFELIDLLPQETHGGSMRYVLCQRGVRKISESVINIIANEKKIGLNSKTTFDEFKINCELSKERIQAMLKELKKEGKKVVGYGATSKSTTILNYCKIGPDLIEFISDTTPIKQNKFTPGMHIPVKTYEEFIRYKPEIAVLFAWNHKKEIEIKEKEFIESGGKFISHLF